MPKAYWIARVDVRDSEQYALYAAKATELFRQYGARVLARGGRALALEGEPRARNVVIEFDDIAQAQTCYASPEYQKARLHRLGVSDGEIVIVEGT
jgi:uncharacterized protein (DUF1330 family)